LPDERHLVVDGANVVGSRPDGWWRDRTGAMRRLCDELGEFARRTGDDVTVVLDGAPRDLGDHHPVDVRFASRRGPNAADDDIAALAAADADPASLRVVTSDSALAERVAAAGARAVGAGEFRRRLDTLVAAGGQEGRGGERSSPS